ncbi:hypothetical protein B0T26DRAFT_688237, partial [Lasiosphaeria miniovina]
MSLFWVLVCMACHVIHVLYEYPQSVSRTCKEKEKENKTYRIWDGYLPLVSLLSPLATYLHYIPQPKTKTKGSEKRSTYNTRDSLVVTHPTTSLAIRSLS